MPWAETDEKRPRILLVDDDDFMLPIFAEHYRELGFEVIMACVGTPTIRDADILHMNIDEAVRYAMNPANRIDTVLTDLYDKGRPYGFDLTKLLLRHGFNGPVAVHSSRPDDSGHANLVSMGALGLFKNSERDKIADTLKQALQKRGQSPAD